MPFLRTINTWQAHAEVAARNHNFMLDVLIKMADSGDRVG